MSFSENAKARRAGQLQRLLKAYSLFLPILAVLAGLAYFTGSAVIGVIVAAAIIGAPMLLWHQVSQIQNLH